MNEQLHSRRGVFLGVLLGASFGVWNLLNSLLDPLAEDTIPALLTFYGPMFMTWAAVGFVASRRTRRLVDGIKAGAVVAFVTFVVFDLMVILRVNLFLESLTDRLDWQNLMAKFHASESQSLRAFINYHYVTQSPFKILVATTIGACTGVIGGLLSIALIRCRKERIAMKAYVVTTGAIFGLLTLAHVWRVIEEGSQVANPAFVHITLLSGVLCVWAWRVFVLSNR